VAVERFPLEQANAEIPVLLSHLHKIGYKGDFVMEAARGEAGKELAWVRHNREFVLSQLQAAGFRFLSELMKILIIGLGSIGQRHLRNLRALLGDDVEILA